MRRIIPPNDRTGAATVEFAIVAPIFFAAIFACFEFGHLMMAESYVEHATFEAARHIKVIGAKKQEAQTFVDNQLAIMGLENANVQVFPEADGVAQTEIDGSTESVRVVVTLPLENNSVINIFGKNRNIVREASVKAERIGQ